MRLGEQPGIRMRGAVLILHQVETMPEGSTGSVVDHVGIRLQDGEAAMAFFREQGLKTEPTALGCGHAPDGNCGMAYTAEGAKLEVFESKDQAEPLRFDHVHFFVHLPLSTREVQGWYVERFGAVATTAGASLNDAASLPGVSLRFREVTDSLRSTSGRAIESLGFDIVSREGGKQLSGEVSGKVTAMRTTGGWERTVIDPLGVRINLAETKGEVSR